VGFRKLNVNTEWTEQGIGKTMAITASDLMTHRVVTLSPEMTLSEMDSLLVRHGISGAPVVEGGRLVGVASQADVVRTLWEGQHEAANQPAYYSSPSPIPISALGYIAKDAHRFGDQLIDNTVRDIMTKDPLFVHPDDPVEKVATRLVNDQIHRLPVTERETGELVGIISSLDLVRAVTLYGLVSVG
jgi:CBS domain-containing protein